MHTFSLCQASRSARQNFLLKIRLCEAYVIRVFKVREKLTYIHFLGMNMLNLAQCEEHGVGHDGYCSDC